MGRSHSHHHHSHVTHHHHHSHISHSRGGRTYSPPRAGALGQRYLSCLIPFTIFVVLLTLGGIITAGISAIPTTYDTMWLVSGQSSFKTAPVSPPPSYLELMVLTVGPSAAAKGVFYASLKNVFVDVCTGSEVGSGSGCTNKVSKSWSSFTSAICSQGFSRCSEFKKYKDAVDGLPGLTAAAFAFGLVAAICMTVVVVSSCMFCRALPDSEAEYLRYVRIIRVVMVHLGLAFIAGILSLASTLRYSSKQNVTQLTPTTSSSGSSKGIAAGAGLITISLATGFFLAVTLLDVVAILFFRKFRDVHPMRPGAPPVAPSIGSPTPVNSDFMSSGSDFPPGHQAPQQPMSPLFAQPGQPIAGAFVNPGYGAQPVSQPYPVYNQPQPQQQHAQPLYAQPQPGYAQPAPGYPVAPSPYQPSAPPAHSMEPYVAQPASGVAYVPAAEANKTAYPGGGPPPYQS
eukprot:ANDGO_03449.mRNA.1 RNA polymerase II